MPPLKIQCATSMRSDVGWVCSLQFFFGLGTMFLNFLGYTVFVLTGRNVTKSCQEAQDSVTGRPAGYHVQAGLGAGHGEARHETTCLPPLLRRDKCKHPARRRGFFPLPLLPVAAAHALRAPSLLIGSVAALLRRTHEHGYLVHCLMTHHNAKVPAARLSLLSAFAFRHLAGKRSS